jgi:GDPmannose 4,6-dehydratase
MKIKWSGKGPKEVGKDEKGRVIVRVDPRFYRPRETNDLLADPSKSRRLLKWQPKVTFEGLVKLMAEADYRELSGDKHFSFKE